MPHRQDWPEVVLTAISLAVLLYFTYMMVTESPIPDQPVRAIAGSLIP